MTPMEKESLPETKNNPDAPETPKKESKGGNRGFPSGRLFLALLALFLFLALPNALETHGLWPDEALYLGATKNMLAGKGLVLGTEKGIFPGLPLLSSAILLISGGGFTKAPFYLATVLMALLSIIFTYFLAKKLAPKGDAFVPLGASALLAFNHIFFFYSSRALLDIYDAAICTGALLLATNYLEKPSRKGAILFGILASIGYLVRLPNLAGISAIFLGAHFSSGKARKDFLSLGAFVAGALLPSLAWIGVSGTGVLGVYSGASGNYFQMALSNLGNFWQSAGFLLISPFALLASIAGFFLLRKNPLFPTLLIFSIFSPISRLAGIPYDSRYFMSTLPVFSITLALLAGHLIRKAVRGNETATRAVFSILLIGASIFTYSVGEGMHNSKKGGYLEIEYSGEWLAKNAESEPAFAGAYRIVSLFHNGPVIPFPQTEEELIARLEAGEAKYLEINNYDWAQPQYALSLQSKYPKNFILEKQFINAQGAGSAVLRYAK